MVNINLLEKEKLRRRRQRSLFTPPEKSNFRFLAYALAIIAVFFTFYLHWNAKKELVAASARRAELQEQSAQLAAIQVEADKYEKIKAMTLDRIDSIKQLEKSQGDPLLLMNSIVNGISSGSSIWLTQLKKEDSSVSIKGRALNVPAIADLIEALNGTPPFEKVEINYWEDQNQSIEFDLSCEIEIPEAELTPEESGVDE